MEFKYKQVLTDNNLSVSTLPEDAQTGIDQINDVMRALNMLKKKGKTPTAKTVKKLKALDKWVMYEILDFVQDTDNNSEEIPHEADEIIEEIKEVNMNKEENSDDKDYQLGLKIESGFDKMITSKSEWEIEEVRSVNRAAYDLLFDTYNEGEDNGIVTSKYSFTETDNGTFELKTI